MACATEELESVTFSYLVVSNLNFLLKTDTQFSHWKHLSMFGTTLVCESALSTVHFMKPKYRSNIFSENVASERWAINKVTICTSFSTISYITQRHPSCKRNLYSRCQSM